MNKLLTWSMAMLLPAAVWAQSPITFINSAEYIPKEKPFMEAVKEVEGQGYFYFGIDDKQRKDNVVEVVHLSPDLKSKKQKSINFSNEWKRPNSAPDIFEMQNHIYFLIREENKTNNEELLAMEFMPSTLTFSKEKKKLIELTGNSNYECRNGIKFYRYCVSANESKLLALYNKRCQFTLAKNNYEEKVFTVMDEMMNVVWSKEFKMPYSEADMEIYQYKVTNTGKVYILAGIRNPKDNDSKTTNRHFEILVYDKETIEKPMVFVPNLDDNYARSSLLIENEKGEVFLTGIFSKSTGSTLDGFYALKLEESTSWATKLDKGFFEIPNDLIKSNQTKKEIKKLDKAEAKADDKDQIGISELVIQYAVFAKNGDMILMAEQSYNPSFGGPGVSSRSTADDIYLTRIRPNGQSWIRKISKAQYSGNMYGYELSFNYILNEDMLHIVFVDSKRNIDKGLDEVAERNGHGPKNYICGVTITPEGQMTKSIVLKVINEDTQELNLSLYSRGAKASLFGTKDLDRHLTTNVLKVD